jgi:hypothetical protein
VVNDLKELMRENVAVPPPDHLDLDALVVAGRRRVRRRRTALVGGLSLVAVGAVAATAVSLGGGVAPTATADTPPAPDAPTISLRDASPAVEGTDYQVLASHTNQNLDRDNGQYFDGVTDDGMILYRDGPHGRHNTVRWGLLDPATSDIDWLPDADLGDNQAFPLVLGADQLVLATVSYAQDDNADSPPIGRLVAHVFDRGTRQWRTVAWPGLPQIGYPNARLGPDGRLYLLTPATQGSPPPGGWPTGPDGEADDADAEGDSYHLWSVSLDDPSDARDEQLTLGSFAFTDDALVWSDRTNGDPGRIHVRDLATGDEHSFDPHAGAKCNLLSFGATDDRVVMGEYCGTYPGEIRDDRVQVLSLDGDQVVTLQDSDVDGGLTGGSLVSIDSYQPGLAGAYVYDLATERFLRLSDGMSRFALGGFTTGDLVLWDTPENHGHGATQRLGRLLPP